MSINRSDINPASLPESSPQIGRAPALAPLVAPKPKGGSSLLLVIAALVAVGGLAFAGGRISAPTAVAGSRGSFAGFPTASGAPGAAAFRAATTGGRTVEGTISALTADSLTLTTTTGSETITLAPTTTYHAQAAAVASAATVGAKVIVSINTPAFTGGTGTGAGTGLGTDAGTGTAGAGNGAGTTPRAISATDVLIESK